MAFSGSVEKIRQLLDGEVRSLGETSSELSQLLCHGVNCDTRELSPGNLFVARKGESVDGHQFLGAAFSSGAQCALVDQSWLENADLTHLASEIADCSGDSGKQEFYVIGVNDTTLSLGRLAAFWRDKLAIPTIAITGSNGKTTTKEIVSSLLKHLVGPGTASIKSYNNHVGLPLTILNADESSCWLVVEAGMNHPGELNYLGGIAKPDICVILEIGPAHLGFFDSLDAIADGKCELLYHIRNGGYAVIKKGDCLLEGALRRAKSKCSGDFTTVTFGVDSKADFSADELVLNGFWGTEFFLQWCDEKAQVKLSLLGRHNVENATAAAAAVLLAFPDIRVSEVAEVMAKVTSVPMRLEILDLADIQIINDAYNANPLSVRAGIETVRELASGGSFAVVLGDMLELGDKSPEFHQEIGRVAVERGASYLVAVGEFAADTVRGAKDAGLNLSFAVDSAEDAATVFLENMPGKLKIILVKGSRRVRLEETVKKLTEKFHVVSSSVPTA